jgi:hypothetical protein
VGSSKPEPPLRNILFTAERYGAMLVDAPCLIAAVSMDGSDILFQNKLSEQYHKGPGYLDVLFSLQENAMKEVSNLDYSMP